MFLTNKRGHMNIKNIALTLPFLFATTTGYAFSVDSMVKVSDKNGNGVFTLTSTKGEPEYISGEIEQVSVEDGAIKNKTNKR